jgi:capsular polysaccharide export protein
MIRGGESKVSVPANDVIAERENMDGEARHFLFLSMPFGPFGRELAERLRHSGARVTRVLLNGGDVFDWGLKDGAPYFGAWSNWNGWIRDLCRRHRFTDIVTYGDSSPHAAAALALAGQGGIRSHVLEQGYFRPDWVTLETQGVNANSGLPRNPAWYRNHPAAKDRTKAEIVGRTTPEAVWHIMAYHLAMYAGAVFFPRYRAHYSEPAIKQAAGHVVRYGLQPLRRSHDKNAYEKLARREGPVFLCVLQRPGDSQLWRHSDYASFPAFMDRVVGSFALHAPSDAKLVVRPHPLDPGLVPHAKILAATAAQKGVSERVCLTDYGKLHDILPRMTGVVCINSTAGLAAVEFGKPTITLGRAMYDMEGLTHQGDLDGFWAAPQVPDAKLYEAFRRVVMAETQVNGAYATAKGRDMAVPEMARRLLGA